MRDGRIDPDAPWGYGNYTLSVVPYLGAVAAGVVPELPVAAPPARSRFIDQAGLRIMARAADPGNPGHDLHLYDLPSSAGVRRPGCCFDGLQPQGDLIVIPLTMIGTVTTSPWGRWRTVAPTGVELVRGAAGNNPHTLIAGARDTCRWTTDWRDPTLLGIAVFSNSAPAYLLHPEHGASGVAPGTWLVRRQQERGVRSPRLCWWPTDQSAAVDTSQASLGRHCDPRNVAQARPRRFPRTACRGKYCLRRSTRWGPPMSVRKMINTCLIVAMGAGALVGVAQPASGRAGSVAELSSWAYTDSVSPFKSFRNGTGDLPVGAWRDAIDKRHLSKSYFTFTLPSLRGARILAAEVNVRETRTNDCTKPRMTELWLTDTDERPTWQYQPHERVRLAGPGGSTGCTGLLGWSAGEVVRDAVAAGRTKITLALRMPQEQQHDPAFGRWYAPNPVLFVSYNFPPATPIRLMFDHQPCGGEPFLPRGFQSEMSAVVNDPDQGESLTGQFALWPVDRPDQRFERVSSQGFDGSVVSVGVPDDLLVDDRTYDWTVRAVDGDGDASAWAPSCRFTTDFTAPVVEPSVSAVPGDPGQPWRFTFTANGVADVTGFRYGAFDPGIDFVPADRLGGSASIELTPRTGRNTLYVRSVDRAGNLSQVRQFDYFVSSTAPTITSSPADGGNGVAREFTFSPNLRGVVSYLYRFNGGPETMVAAAGDGTGRVTLTPDRPGFNQLTARGITASGAQSESSFYGFSISGGPAPSVHSDVYPPDGGGGPAIPGTFDFTPTMPGVVAYVYTFDGAPETVVAARPDGSASVTLTPMSGDTWANLDVFSRSADGSVSELINYSFFVNGSGGGRGR
ncbi:MAG: hypothetical protein ACJ72N_05430 [Labedaea sp.]